MFIVALLKTNYIILLIIFLIKLGRYREIIDLILFFFVAEVFKVSINNLFSEKYRNALSIDLSIVCGIQTPIPDVVLQRINEL